MTSASYDELFEETRKDEQYWDRYHREITRGEVWAAGKRMGREMSYGENEQEDE